MTEINTKSMGEDILDNFARLRIAFQAANMEPPASINLASHDEGMRFLSAIARTNFSYQVGSELLGKPLRMADGSTVMEMQLMGIKVRWPADRIAMPDGSWSWV